eukprot:scaffold6727_cov106-Isochrysis_galbana.AAC.7
MPTLNLRRDGGWVRLGRIAILEVGRSGPSWARHKQTSAAQNRMLKRPPPAHQTGLAKTSLSAVRPHQWMASTHAAGGQGTGAGGSAEA